MTLDRKPTSAKKPYQKPELIEYGPVSELTLGQAGTKNGDGSGQMTMN